MSIHENQKFLTIGKAAEALGVSVQTLRRWEKNGKLRPGYISPGKHRYYAKDAVRQYTRDLFVQAKSWASASADAIPSVESAYCQTSSIFQARLSTFETFLRRIPDLEKDQLFSLVVSIVGEIGDNAFAHNLGKWPDIPGVFFGYDTNRRHVVVADRGVGVLATLRQVRPRLHDDAEALKVAFTERLSSRALERRGNGLKYVREVVQANRYDLSFQSGNAILKFDTPHHEMQLLPAEAPIRGTLAFLEF